jgi:hypothetical protein
MSRCLKCGFDDQSLRDEIARLLAELSRIEVEANHARKETELIYGQIVPVRQREDDDTG